MAEEFDIMKPISATLDIDTSTMFDELEQEQVDTLHIEEALKITSVAQDNATMPEMKRAALAAPLTEEAETLLSPTDVAARMENAEPYYTEEEKSVLVTDILFKDIDTAAAVKTVEQYKKDTNEGVLPPAGSAQERLIQQDEAYLRRRAMELRTRRKETNSTALAIFSIMIIGGFVLFFAITCMLVT